MKKNRLYNVLFPLWFFLFFPMPPIFFITLAGNALIDSAVLALACRNLRREFLPAWKKSFWKIFLIGYLADLCGGSVLLFLSTVTDSALSYALVYNPYSHLGGFLIVAAMTALTGVLIGFLNERISLRGLGYSRKERKKAALYLAVLTAPYLFLVPSVLFYR